MSRALRGCSVLTALSRSCVGRHFAEVEAVITLAMIARRYTIHLDDGVDPYTMLDSEVLLTSRPKKPLRLTFRRRDRVPVAV